MTPYYRRTTPSASENLGAALVAAGLALGVASVSFYLVRIFLAREPLDPPSGPSSNRRERNGELPSTTGPEEDGG